MVGQGERKKIAMIIFRILLYAICFSSITWSCIVFGGPFIVKSLVSSYTDGAVKLSNVSVSPMFDVSIGRVDFNIQNNRNGIPLSGFSRSTEITWSFKTDQPFLSFDIGPTSVKGVSSVENIKIHTPSYYDMDLQNWFLAGNAYRLNMKSLGIIDQVYFKGSFDRQSNKIYDLNFDAQMVGLKNGSSSLSAASVTGDLSEYNLGESLEEQTSTGRFEARNVLFEKPDLSIENARGAFDIARAAKNITVKLKNTNFSTFGGAVHEIKLNGQYDKNYLLQTLNIHLTDGDFGGNLPKFSNITAEMLKGNKTQYEFNAVGDSHKFEIYDDDNYVGLLPSTDFNLYLEFDVKKSNFRGNSTINFVDFDLAEVDSSIDFGFNIQNFKSINDCAISLCKISDLYFKYQLTLDEDWINGSSVCYDTYCNLDAMNHILTTSNTENIFTVLNRAGVLNPLYSMYLYAAVSSGQKINAGHKLKF